MPHCCARSGAWSALRASRQGRSTVPMTCCEPGFQSAAAASCSTCSCPEWMRTSFSALCAHPEIICRWFSSPAARMNTAKGLSVRSSMSQCSTNPLPYPNCCELSHKPPGVARFLDWTISDERRGPSASTPLFDRAPGFERYCARQGLNAGVATDLKKMHRDEAHSSRRATASTPVHERKRPGGHKVRRFEQLVAELSRRFVRAPVDGIDYEINRSLKDVCLLLGLDRSAVAQIDPVSGWAAISHGWARESNRVMPTSLDPNEYLPWHKKKMLAGEPSYSPAWMNCRWRLPLTVKRCAGWVRNRL
jgi:hypothetical protein